MGQVQQMDYKATSILVNLNNKPTYNISKRCAGLVKMYAFVDLVVIKGNSN